MQFARNGKLLWDDVKFAKLYSSAERLTGFFGEKLLQQVEIQSFARNKHLSILDNACGTGVVTEALHQSLQDRPTNSFDITCADLADAMVAAMTQRIINRGWTNTNALKADAQDTKLPSNNFTHIFTNFGPMLFPNPSAMLSECIRMLQPGGVCAFTTWKKVGWIEDVREAFESMPDLPAFPSAEKIAAGFAKGNWDDEEYVQDILSQHGFENIKVTAVPNESVIPPEEFIGSLRPTLAIVYRFWSEEDREQYGNEETEAKIEQWFRKKYAGGPVRWQWIALVTTSNKSS